MNFPLNFKFHLSPIALHGAWVGTDGHSWGTGCTALACCLTTPARAGWAQECWEPVQSTRISPGNASPLPYPATRTGTWSVKQSQAHAGKTRDNKLATREVSAIRTFSHWNRWSHKGVQSPSLKVPWSFQPELLYNSTTSSLLPSMLCSHELLLHSHFQALLHYRKMGGNRHKTIFKSYCTNSDLYFCLFEPYIPSCGTVLGRTVIQTFRDRTFFFFWIFVLSSSRVSVFSWILLMCGFNLEKFQSYSWYISYLPVDTNFFRTLKFPVEATILKKWGQKETVSYVQPHCFIYFQWDILGL